MFRFTFESRQSARAPLVSESRICSLATAKRYARKIIKDGTTKAFCEIYLGTPATRHRVVKIKADQHK
jgi:hypothetical protein